MRGTFFFGGVRLVLQGRLKSDSGKFASGAECRHLGQSKDLPIGSRIADVGQFTSHGQGLIDQDGLKLATDRDGSFHEIDSW